MPPVVKIRGRRGDWTAEADGERLPVLHDTWRNGADYHDPMVEAKIHGKRYRDHVELLRRADCAIIQRDKGNGDLARRGYHGVWRISDCMVHEDGSISLHILEKAADAAK